MFDSGDSRGSEPLSRDVLDALSEGVRGPLFTPELPGYDAQRHGFQTARQHRPAVVVGATGAADIGHAIEVASCHRLPVAVQGAGHALAAVAGEPGGVLINTSRMTGLRIDVDRGIAWVAAGVRWNQVVHEAARVGLAPLSGSAPHIAVVPYTLGGGIGLLSRQFGYAADLVPSIDAITADGSLRHVTAGSDEDLFWAMRGGRDNFGIAVGMEIALLPVVRLYGGGMYFAPEHVPTAWETYVGWTREVPDELSSSIALISYPDLPAVPEPLRGRRVAHLRIAYNGDPAVGAEVVAEWRRIPRLIDDVGEISYVEADSIYNEPSVPAAFEATNVLLGAVDRATVSVLLEHAGPRAALPSMIELRHLGGRLGHRPVPDNSVGNRDAEYLVVMSSRLDSVGTAEAISVHDGLIDALRPWDTGGRSLNFLNGAGAQGSVESAYDPASYKRLREIKSHYDPGNMFRLNHNIPPL